MNRKTQLEKLIKSIFRHDLVDSVPISKIISDLDYESLSQALRAEAEPIFRFRTDNEAEARCEYRSELLFHDSGTFLIDQVVAEESSVVSMERSRELWLLDDLTPVVLAKAEFRSEDDLFTCEYRTVRARGLEELNSEIDLDLRELAEKLWELTELFDGGPLPYHEL